MKNYKKVIAGVLASAVMAIATIAPAYAWGGHNMVSHHGFHDRDIDVISPFGLGLGFGGLGFGFPGFGFPGLSGLGAAALPGVGLPGLSGLGLGFPGVGLGLGGLGIPGVGLGGLFL